MTTTQPDLIAQAWKTAAERAAGIIPHTLKGRHTADADDLRQMVKDLLVFCERVVDPLVEAYGETARLCSGVTIDTDLFKRQLLGALEGNALYELESAAEQMERERYEDASEPQGSHREFA